jgi:hypothetical protein
MAFFETSAFNDINVDEAFAKLAKDVNERLESGGGIINGPGASKTLNNNNGPRSISSTQFEPTPAPKKSSWCSLL